MDRLQYTQPTAFKTSNFLLFCSITTICAYYSFIHNYNVTLDDAFIYFRVVENLLETGKPEFNIGDNYFVVTSALWTFMLALGKIMLPFLEIETIAKLFWFLSLVFASFFAYLTFIPFIKNWSCFIGIPFFLSPIICSMMGTEIALLYAATFATFWAYSRNKPVYIGIGLAVGYLARGEFILISLPLFLHLLVTRRKNKQPYTQFINYLLKISIVTLLLALIWHLYYYCTFHGFFPTTLKAKMIQGQSGLWKMYPQHIWPYIKELLDDRTFLLIFAVIGMVRQPYIFFLMGSYTLLHSLIYFFLRVPHYPWYYYDYYIFTLILIFFGTFWVLNVLSKVFISKLLQYSEVKKTFANIFVNCFFIAFVIWFFPIHFNEFDLKYLFNIDPKKGIAKEGRLFSQQERYNSYVKLSKKLQRDLRKDDVILTTEIGILSYYLKDYEIRDINGLASPNVTAKNINDYNYFANYYKPRFIVAPLILRSSVLLNYDGNFYRYKKHFVLSPDETRFPATVYILGSQWKRE